MKKLYVLGVGHYTPVCIDLALDCNYEIAGLFHFNNDRTGETDHGFRILGSFDDLFANESLSEMSFLFSMGDTRIRQSLAEQIKSKGGKVPTLVHPSANISRFTTISEENVLIFPQVVIQADTTIHENSIICGSSIICHHSIIGKNCFIAPKALIGAYTNIENNVFIGQGALSISGKVKNIGENAVIGARALLTKDIPANSTVIGIPAKPIKDGRS